MGEAVREVEVERVHKLRKQAAVRNGAFCPHRVSVIRGDVGGRDSGGDQAAELRREGGGNKWRVEARTELLYG